MGKTVINEEDAIWEPEETPPNLTGMYHLS